MGAGGNRNGGRQDSERSGGASFGPVDGEGIFTTEETPGKASLAEELLAVYRQDHAAGILDARLRWKELDDELLNITRGWALAAEHEMEEADSVTALGIDAYEWAFFVEAQNTVSFHKVLEVIAAHEGDPPAGDALRSHSLDILSGRMNLPGALRVVAADRPLLSALPHIFQTFLPGVDPEEYSALSQAVRVAAAAALPRPELLRLRGVVEDGDAEQEAYEEIRAQYRGLMKKLNEDAAIEDPLRREELLLKALDVAAKSPEPDDDIETIQLILEMADRFSLSAYSVRRCVDAVHSLVAEGHAQPELARSIVALGPLVAARNLKAELAPEIVETCQALTRSPLPQDMRYSLATTAARALLWMDRADDAEAVLQDALGMDPDPVNQIEIAMLKADVCVAEDNRHLASAILTEVLDRTKSLDGRNRLPAIRKLLAVWPKTRNTRELYRLVRELGAVAGRLPEPRRTLVLVTSLLKLVSLGERQWALELWNLVDFERIRYSVPEKTAQRLEKVVRRAATTLGVEYAPDDLMDETTVIHRPDDLRPEKPPGR